ncbi:hypothetical protein DEU40_10567 [Chryseobacterium sp. AG844]|nr:hypothetical protein DEU40_10567 [Chryseobacterium sp. AG844]
MVGLVNFITPTLKHSHPVPRTPQPATRNRNPQNSHPHNQTPKLAPRNSPLTHLPENSPTLKHSNPKTHFLDAFATGL